MNPSSLGAKTLRVAGFTAAVLMHHSRTALGNVVLNRLASGVGPITVSTSRISTSPPADGCGSICVLDGSSSAMRLTPSPSATA